MTIDSFIKIISPLVISEGKKRGYRVVSPVIAQAIIEGRYGNSYLAAKYHNHFGIKCGSKWTGKSVNMATGEEYTPGVHTKINALFRTYDSDADGIKGYYDFIATARYANLKNSNTPLEYITNLKKDGYATSSTYINTLNNTVIKYNLTVYDNFDLKKSVTAKVVNDVIAGKYGCGDERRIKLTSEGYIYNDVQAAVNSKLGGKTK